MSHAHEPEPAPDAEETVVETAPDAPASEGPAAADAPPPSGTAQEPADELAQAQGQVAALTADLQRLQAEYVNYKRRVDRDRELVRQNATFSVLAGMLPVLDDIERAREHGEVTGGFKAVADSLTKSVTALGLSRFGEPGDPFDPTIHEALMHGHSPDVTETVCDKIVQAGYRMGDRVVRAAMVTVLDPESGGGEGAAAEGAADGGAGAAGDGVAAEGSQGAETTTDEEPSA